MNPRTMAPMRRTAFRALLLTFFAALAVLLAWPSVAHAVVINGGNLTTQTWTANNSPYQVMGDVTVLANETLTIVVPQFVPRRSWQNLLHAQTALFLRMALLFRRGIVVTNVPYQLADS